MEINSEVIRGCEITNEGTTCFIMRAENGAAFKVYKNALGYIAGNSEYDMDEGYVMGRLSHIVSQRDSVKKTQLPSDILFCNGKAVGIKMPYYENAQTLRDYLISNPDVDLGEVKNEVHGIVGELIEHGIVPADPHFENFLVTFDETGKRKLNMVDVDDHYVSVYPEGAKRGLSYDIDVSACYRVIDLSIEDVNSKRNGSIHN